MIGHTKTSGKSNGEEQNHFNSDRGRGNGRNGRAAGEDLPISGEDVKVGDISRKAVESLGVETEVIDASGCIVAPGFIDPHQHLLGGSGEEGFASQTPEIAAGEVISSGITTVVGCLGSDTTMKTLPGLLAKVKGLKEEGLNAYMWSGGYKVPSPSITGSVRDDVMFIEEVIGAGEVAIADNRSSQPTPHELARLAHDVHVGGMLSMKAGIVNIHVGSSEERLKLLHDVIQDHAVKPEWLYATHITRSEKLMLEAIELAKNGSFVDMDTVDENLADCLKFYLEHSGWEEKLTVSSDASKTSPANLFKQIRSCILDAKMPIETVLPLVTSNTANILKLPHKGRVQAGKAADVLVITKKDFELRDVFSLGRRLVTDNRLAFHEKFLEDSNRKVILEGARSNGHFIGDGIPKRLEARRKAAAAEPFKCEGK